MNDCCSLGIEQVFSWSYKDDRELISTSINYPGLFSKLLPHSVTINKVLKLLNNGTKGTYTLIDDRWLSNRV